MPKLFAPILILASRVLAARASGPETIGSPPTCSSDADGSAMLQLKQRGLHKKAPKDSALIVIDMQNDFINGSLTVTGGDSIVPTINALANLEGWDLVAYTMDYHPNTHISFAENSPFNKQNFEFVNLAYDSQGRVCGQEYVGMYGGSANPSCAESEIQTNFSQQLWPVHCVQGTWGQMLDAGISKAMPSGVAVVKKGYSTVIDSYGAFENNRVFYSETSVDGEDYEIESESSLNRLLEVAGVKNVYLVGLALDYCVKYTGLQAVDLGFNTILVEDATKPVYEDQGVEAVELFKESGVHVVQASEVPHCPWR